MPERGHYPDYSTEMNTLLFKMFANLLHEKHYLVLIHISLITAEIAHFLVFTSSLDSYSIN